MLIQLCILIQGINRTKSNEELSRTNRDDSLSDTGVEQVQNVCMDLISRNINPSVVKYSLAAKSIESADMIAGQILVSCVLHFSN